MNFGFINNKNCTVIKQGTCFVNVVSVVNKMSRRVFSVDYNFSIELKNH